MTLDEPTPDGPPEPAPSRLVTFDLSKLPSAGTAAGVGLLSAAVLMSAFHARNTFSFDLGEGSRGLDLSVYLVGVGAVLALLGMAVLGHVLDRTTEPAAVSWPGAAGATGAGVLAAILVDDGPADLYCGAGLALTIALLGLALTRAAPFVVTALASLTLLYVQAFDDIIGGADLGGTEGFITIGAAITAFVIAVSVAGWFLRDTRVLTATLVGIAGLVSLVVLFQALAVTGMLSTAFSSSSEDFTTQSGGITSEGEEYLCGVELDEGEAMSDEALEACAEAEFDEEFDETEFEEEFFSGSSGVTTEVWTILGFCLLLAGFWTGFGLATGHVAFRILVLVDATVMIPVATMALLVEHPTWWQVALCVLGGLTLLVASGVVRRRRAPAPITG